MKPLFATIALLLFVGCQKPDIVATNQDVVRWCLDHQGDANAEHYYCEELHGYKYIFDGIKPNYDKYDSRKLREFGQAKHVTREQWEAAQGLYNPHHVKGFMVSGPSTSGTVVTCTGCTITSTATGTMVMSSTGSTKSPCDETFPPSGDAK